MLFDRDVLRYIRLFASAFYSGLFFVAAHRRAYRLFMIIIGVVAGLSSAILVTVAQSVIAHGVHKSWGLPSGTSMIGSALGGVVFPLVLRYALPKSGWHTAIFVLGGIMAVCLIAGNCLVEGRMKPSRSDSQISFKCFSDSEFLWTTLTNFGKDETIPDRG